MEELFRTLGLDPTQAQTYQALIEVGRTTPSNLAKQLRIPRTSAYYALDALAKHGLVVREEDSDRLYYSARDPKAFLLMVEKEKAALEQKEKAAVELEKKLRRGFKGENHRVPKVKFHSGSKSVENFLYDEVEKWHESIALRGNIFWGFQDHSFVEQYGQWLKLHWTIRDQNQEIRIFSNDSAIEKQMKGKVERRYIRPGPPQLNFESTLWICGDYLVVLMTRDKPHYAYEIKDEVLSTTLRKLFQALWEIWR